MPDCTLILARHCGPAKSKLKPGAFAAKAIASLCEGRMSNGNALHVIHDLVPAHPINDEFIAGFERMAQSRRVLRSWKEGDREWREDAKRQMERADRGESVPMLSAMSAPEAAFILEANRQRPNTIINHLGFYPLEAAIEHTRYRIHLDLSGRRIRMRDMRGGISHLMAAHEAMASCNLLRDYELMKQISILGHDAIALRGPSNGYLGELGGLDIPIVEDGGKVSDFAKIAERRGIRIVPLAEGSDPTFSDEAIGRICRGGIGQAEHRRLALLDIMFTSILNMAGLWDEPEGFDTGRSVALRDYDGLRQEIYGG